MLFELGRSLLEDAFRVVSDECWNAYFLAEVSLPSLLPKLLFLLRRPLLLVLLLEDHMQVGADLMEQLRVLELPGGFTEVLHLAVESILQEVYLFAFYILPQHID